MSFNQKEYLHEYYLAHKEEISERSNQWRKGHLEQHRISNRIWTRNNPDKQRSLIREWKNANPKKLQEYAAKRRAYKLGASIIETVSLKVLAERDQWICGICGESVDITIKHPDPLSASHDHIVPLSKGGDHSYNNAQLAHLTCNIGKGARC